MMHVCLFLYHPQVILKEREERKQKRLLEERGLLPEQGSEPVVDAAEEEQCNVSNTTGENKHFKRLNGFEVSQM